MKWGSWWLLEVVEAERVPLLKGVVAVRRPAGGDRERIPFPSLRLFSATTLMDFSYTFHNFIVLSANKCKRHGFKLSGRGAVPFVERRK